MARAVKSAEAARDAARAFGMEVVRPAGSEPSAGREGPLRLVRVTPNGRDVPSERQIVFQFDRPVVPLGRMARSSEEIPSRLFVDHYERLSRLGRVRSFIERATQSERGRTNARLDLLGIASKIACSETSFQVASDAMQILGEDGLSPEYPIEKMFRDARASTIEDGANEMLALAGAEGL